MAFKGIEDRFKSKSHDLYRKYSTKDGSNREPYLEIKPDDITRGLVNNDSRSIPIGSTSRDLVRIGKWSASTGGLFFLVKQEVLQLGNTFSETQIINPLFVIGNVVPYLHLRRPIATPSDFSVKVPSGTTHARMSPASTAKIGAAGRLQVKTSKEVSKNLLGTGGRNNIFSYLPSGKIIDTVRSILSIKDKGSLGVDQRPELDFNGEYFSIALWKGFQRQGGAVDNLQRAAQSLRTGDFKGAYANLKISIGNIKDQILGKVPDAVKARLSIPDNRNSANFKGTRYFITGPNSNDSYLRNVVTYDTSPDGSYDIPVLHLSGLKRRPYIIGGSSSMPDSTVNKLTQEGRTQLNSLKEKTNTSLLKKVRGGLSSKLSSLSKNPTLMLVSNVSKFSPTMNLNSFTSDVTSNLKKTATDKLNVNTGGSDNPGEDMMMFSGLSLRNRYNTGNSEIDFIKQQIQIQKNSQKAYWEKNTVDLGFRKQYGYKPGEDVDVSPNARAYPVNTGGHFRDDLNLITTVPVSKDGPTSSDVTDAYGGIKDSIHIWFHDYANSEMIPFRAFLSDFNESTTPEFDDRRYIGRNERNIVYMGATREANFRLNIQAFSQGELMSIWRKMERLTGLCFPAGYNNGFMIPPFVKLTLGNIYYNQPCYIRSLTYTIDEGASWETTEGAQVPMGITAYVSVSIIESAQKDSKSDFYGILGGNNVTA